MCVLKQSIPPFNQKPFRFLETGVNVFSYEELLFHSFHYWKESVNDFTEGRISAWVRDTLNLTFIAGQIDKILSTDDMLSEKFIKFLSLEGYFDKDDLQTLEHQIITWENKSELEQLKQQADERLIAEDYEKAAFYYTKLLSYAESASIYNNLGCCYMKLGLFSEAEQSFATAYSLDIKNYKIRLNTAMLYMLQNRSYEAEQLLSVLRKTDDCAYVRHYLGVLEQRRNNIKRAKEHFIRASEMGEQVDSLVALCKIEMKLNNFDAAYNYLKKMRDKLSPEYLYNLAELKYKSGNAGEAVIYIEKLLAKDFSKSQYWVFAAKLYRELKNIKKAQDAIQKALELEPQSEEAAFENAKIHKACGKQIEYQNIIKSITKKWKNNYKQLSLKET